MNFFLFSRAMTKTGRREESARETVSVADFVYVRMRIGVDKSSGSLPSDQFAYLSVARNDDDGIALQARAASA